MSSHQYHPLKPYSFNRPLLQVYGRVKERGMDDESFVIVNHTSDEGQNGRLGPWELKFCHPDDDTANQEAWNRIEEGKLYRVTFTHKIESDYENLYLEGWFIDAEEVEE